MPKLAAMTSKGERRRDAMAQRELLIDGLLLQDGKWEVNVKVSTLTPASTFPSWALHVSWPLVETRDQWRVVRWYLAKRAGP